MVRQLAAPWKMCIRDRYASSTKFYVEDRENGTPWVTKLPFPVHVPERVEVFDYIGRTRLATIYRYRHGYFDGVEREFRGFGYVEQRDAEAFSDSDSLFTEHTGTEADALRVPPVLTKTWFHTCLLYTSSGSRSIGAISLPCGV